MNNDLVTLIAPPTEFEANILAIVLRDHGIEAFVFAAPSLGIGVPLSGGTIGVPLQVRHDDLDRARQILLENKRHSIDIDWDELDLEGSPTDEYVAKQMPVSARIAFFFAVTAALTGLAFIFHQIMN